MSAAEQQEKTFYLETFGCQMNAHDSEKVVGTLVSQGYRQVPTVEEAGLVLYNTCSIRDKAEQKVFHRLADYKKPRGIVFVPGIRRSPSGKADLRWAQAVAAEAASGQEAR